METMATWVDAYAAPEDPVRAERGQLEADFAAVKWKQWQFRWTRCRTGGSGSGRAGSAQR
ncbi:hypothetical protein EAI_16004 [Harpegnathos saltator]|uniref:Uncharacterized protein n=2 Tax=Harpegnathos saltator TaxID=610380 RepID=E2BG52_HARSA|nr:hypothetical protein EAI_16004 [Harpegnathos saltator]